jgi:flagellar biosynthesis/type III secretory pathway chaperone
MNTNVRELVRLLEEELSLHKELLSNVTSERDMLRRFAVRELEENSKSKETLILKIRLTEEARRKVIAQLARSLDEEEDLSLSRIVYSTPQPWKERLEGLRAELLDVMGRIQELNSRNHSMAVYATGAMTHLLSLFSFAAGKSGTYDYAGRSKGQTGVPVMISRSV